MVKLEGIIYKVFESYVVLRGFAPIRDLAAISEKPKSYQRPTIDSHKDEIVQFLDDFGSNFRYFPEITLAFRVNKYEDFIKNFDNGKVLRGIPKLKEIHKTRTRATNIRIVSLELNDKLAIRVDGNHRLEAFDKTDNPIWTKFDINKIGSLIVPFAMFFSNADVAEKFEAGIFHNINFKQIPLRLEASLKIIIDVDAFDDKEKLGKEYPLAIELIRKIEKTNISSIPWLQNHNDLNLDYYRTSCLRVVQLLQKQESIVEKKKKKAEEELDKSQEQYHDVEKRIQNNDFEIQKFDELIKKIEAKHTDFKIRIQYRKAKHHLETYINKRVLLMAERDEIEYCRNYYTSIIEKCNDYIKKIGDLNSIENAIYRIQSDYNEFNEKQRGNIAFLCAMVYYAILDNTQKKAFINWAKLNGINQIVTSDELYEDSPLNLITMFDQIYQAKKNEVFVSMQFGDSQSELIYEKIMRAIEIFNKKNGSIQLNLHPIRIDRTIEQSTYSIQDKILEAIQNCSLIIADLSSHNINVYHEIGYAMGIAKSNNDMLPNMILLYKENSDHNKDNIDVDKFIGFNLRNLSQLRFKDYDQLVDGLVKRLEKHYGV